ncbi:MAG: polysaccharide biosynthesis/export protein VpsN [Thiomicrorhabdus sp.]|nr:MAG: polysaccharide biosynthesis/export protein VpsN [Thiomicrorhabdus sp.]
MNNVQLLVIMFSFLLFSNVALSSATVSQNSSYKLSSGDVITISVYAEPDLSFDSIRLNESGAFSYPFIGNVKAQGLTAVELQEFIYTALLGDYLVKPRINVSVHEYRQFYISGEVEKPGGYSFQPGLTVRRAVALAGGLTERASKKRMMIIREEDLTKKPQKVDMEALVMAGDIVTIDQGFF